MKNLKSVLWGIVLVAAAIIIALNSFNIINFDLFFDGWWTLFIIIPCISGLFQKRDIAWSLLGLLLGVCLLLSAQNIIDFDVFWKLVIPVIIAYIGFKMIFSSFRKKDNKKRYCKIEADGKEINRGVAIFCGTELDYSNTVFNGANLVACFGGIDCDLSHAIIDSDCVIKVAVAFGGIDIMVPDNVNVINNIPTLFGGTDITGSNPNAEHTIYIDGFCAFGGVDIE